jgi:predicted MFS family arabinose efflux permease
MYQIFYFRDQLRLDLDVIGKMRAWPALAIVVLGYPLGAMIDRLKPIRLVAPSLVFWALINLVAFFFLRDKWSLLVCIGLITLATFIFAISSSVLNVEVFPREKIGQFCSANAMLSQVVGLLLAVPLGMFFDYIQNYSYVFLWSSLFQALSALLFWKVYLNWKRRAPGAGPPERHPGV